MKNVFIVILSFFITVHFIIPYIIYSFGDPSTEFLEYYNASATAKAFWLNFISVALALIFIIYSRTKKIIIEPVYANLPIVYYTSVLYAIVVFFYSGGFYAAYTGTISGTILNYILVFFDYKIIFFIMLLFNRKNYNLFLAFLTFVATITIMGSRSAVMVLIIIFLIFPISANFEFIKSNFKKYLLIIVLISPMLFYYGTIRRGHTVDAGSMQRMILERLSFVNFAMLPVHSKDNKVGDLDLFYEKYNPVYQLKLSFNALFPGDLFKQDVNPNQYYRAAFMGYPKEYVRKSYLSINMTLPVYIYMYSNFIVAVIISALIYILYFRFCEVLYYRSKLLAMAMVFLFYGFLYFFDFVMYFQGLFQLIISVLLAVLLNKFLTDLALYMKSKKALSS